MKNTMKLAVIASSLMLSACGGSSDSPPEKVIENFKVNFNTFNYVYAPSEPISVESEYDDELFEQEQTLNSGDVYGIQASEYLLIQYEGTELPAYEVEIEIVDQNSQLTLAEEELSVNSSTDKQLVFAIGDRTNLSDAPRLKIFDYPDFNLSTGEVGVVVINLRDTTASASSYNLVVDSTLFQSNLEQAELSNTIKVADDETSVSVVVNDNVGGGSQTCTFDISTLPDDWSMSDWIIAFDISDKETCYVSPLL